MCRFIILLIYSITSLAFSQDGQVNVSSDKNPNRDGQKMDDPLQVDALKSSVQRNPFEIWYFKDKFKSLQDIFLTPELISNEIVERTTTKDRLRNAMTRALLGQDIAVAVMGGSISAGGGLINDHSNLKGIFYRVFIDWWEKAVQPFTNSKIALRNLAVGGTSSNFYSFCYKALLKPQEIMDIVFLEFSVNDYMIFRDSQQVPMALSLEELTRRVLREHNSPAVMFVNFIHGVQSIAQCSSLENHGQTMLAWHYGITSFSMRSSLCPNPGNKKTPTMFSSDGNHASIIAHAQIAMMIIDTVRKALVRAIDSSKQDIYDTPSHVLPRTVYSSATGVEGGVSSSPLCYTLITPDIYDKLFNPSLYVKVTENVGFKQVQDEAIGFHRTAHIPSQDISEPSRTDGFGGWQAQRENSTLKLQIYLPLDEILGSDVKRSVGVVFRTYGHGGKAEIWLDNIKPGVVIDTLSGFGHTRLVTVAKNVTSGSHVLSVRTVNSGKFTLCGVTAGGSSVAF